jgi:hypothetical protein
MQNSENFDYLVAEMELKDKYLIQLIRVKQLFKSFNMTQI